LPREQEEPATGLSKVDEVAQAGITGAVVRQQGDGAVRVEEDVVVQRRDLATTGFGEGV